MCRANQKVLLRSEVIFSSKILKREQKHVLPLGACRKRVTHCIARPGFEGRGEELSGSE